MRRETGKELKVKALYDEDLAGHIAPEPCVLSREGQGEASAGDRAGWPSSRERALSRAQDRATTSSGIDRVREVAREKKGERFTTLLHHIDATLLRQAYYWLKRDAAPGVDGMTWDAYGEGLEARLRDLESRIHLGSYRAQPSLRGYIPKPDGRQRPLGRARQGDAPCAGAAKGIARRGGWWTSGQIAGSPSPGLPILGHLNASTSNTQGGSRMREFRP